MSKLHSLDDYKTIHKITDTEHDNVLNELMEQIFTRIQTFTKRQFKSESRTEDFRGTGCMVPLSAIPVTSVTSVTRYSRGNNSQTTETETNTEYDITPYGLFIQTPLKRNEWLRVVYTGGYSETSDVLDFVDSDYSTNIKRAALIQLRHEFNTKSKPAAESMATDTGTVTMNKGLVLLPEVKEALAACVHPYYVGIF